jgi:hypothetical protein
MKRRFESFQDFYLFYLEEHRRLGTRVLHFAGTSLFVIFGAYAFVVAKAEFLGVGVALAYACAWTGHFFVEHNRPATFRYPVYSLRADFVLYWQLLTGQRRFREAPRSEKHPRA